MAKYWISDVPTACDVCQRPISEVFIDGATTMGPWANMDEPCHDLFGFGFGAGKGQRFEKQADGRWLKTEG